MTPTPVAPLIRRAAAEAFGTGALVTVVVGSGIQAADLSRDVGVQLLANALATVFGLGLLIALLGPVSGAHFNPVVSLAAWTAGRRRADGLTTRELAAYVSAQITGGIGGAVLANAMFAQPLVQWSSHSRYATHLWLGETVATAGLIVVIFGLQRTGRASMAPVAVASFIGAAYWFTSSTSFANPAVTVGRAFTDTFAGIAPGSVLPFVTAQGIGALLGLGLVATLFDRPAPREADGAGDAEVPAPSDVREPAASPVA